MINRELGVSLVSFLLIFAAGALSAANRRWTEVALLASSLLFPFVLGVLDELGRRS